MKKNLYLIFVFLLIVLNVSAQRQTITGVVKEKATNEFIPGASIVEKGTSNGTITGNTGEFALSVNKNVTLQISFVGMEMQEIKVENQSKFEIYLEISREQIGDVVVTAFGIKRDKKALGYSVQDVSGQQLTASSPVNIVSSLSGKVAGAQIITSSGQVGASATIKIRGNKSLDGMSQPLFVVDGTPIMNNTNDARTNTARTDFGNSAMDIDPSSIESISILKGPSASALYGSRAADGVILITTKKGSSARKGFSVVLNSSMAFDNVNILPNYQNSYGQGYNGDEYNWKTNYPSYSTYQAFHDAREFKWATDGTGRRMDYDESWGTRLDVGLLVDQMQGKQQPWVSNPNNIKNFYETGVTTSNNIDLNMNSDRVTARFSVGHNKQNGTSPNTDQTKLNLGFNAGFKITDKFKIDVNLNFIDLSNDNLPQTGNSMRNPLVEFNSWFGRQVDMNYLKEHYNDIIDYKGTPVAFNWMIDYPTQHNNPYWLAYNNTMSRDRKRTFGNFSATYTIAKGIDIMGRFGNDSYTEKRFYKFPQYTRDWDTEYKSAGNGTFWKQYQISNETNADLIMTIKKNLTPDISGFFNIGGNYRSTYDQYSSVAGTNLVIPNFYSTSNIEGTPSVSFTDYKKRSSSVFASANLGYKSYLYLDLTYRTDWSSTLPQSNWRYDYPSVNVGFIFTEALKMKSDILSFGKLRAGYAIVGSDTNPYQLTPTYGTGGTPFNGVTLYTQSATYPTNDLKPQKSKSFETGAELKFFKDRISLDLTYYQSRTFNQILGVGVSSATGYSTWYKNAGEIENKGFEIQASGVPVRGKHFEWSIDITWSKNQNSVKSLESGINQLQLSSLYYNSYLMAIPGKPWGEIYGTDYQRNANGNALIGANGLPITTTTSQVLGNVNPDWIGGLRNTFTYKGITFSALIDMRQGGDVVSMTKAVGQYGGITQNTVEGGIRENGMIVEGVYNAGVKINNVDVSGQPNVTRISARTYFKATRPWGSEAVIDGSFIKLREMNLSYTLSRVPMLKEAGIQSLTVGLFGRNLALLYKDKSNDVNIDPEVSTGGSLSGVGIEAYQLPPSRSIGLKVNINF
ncbi:MAG: SusC/RagA family TonB-linked outer membrane protein [Mariniphaga sp.]|nr:SusC/RagA family TonB-linked outer membrane protein [Mariniphaga sp.]